MTRTFYKLEYPTDMRTRFSDFNIPAGSPWLEDVDVYWKSGGPLEVEYDLPIPIHRTIVGGGRPEKLKDMLFTSNAGLLISRALYQVLTDYLPAHSVYPCEISYKGVLESDAYLILNIERTIECFDLERSYYSIWTTDDYRTHKRVRLGWPLTRWYVRWRYRERVRLENLAFTDVLVIRADLVPDDVHAFHLRGAVRPIVSGELRRAVLEAGCTGVAFTPVGTSSAGKSGPPDKERARR